MNNNEIPFIPQLFPFCFGHICMWKLIPGHACRIGQKTWNFRCEVSISPSFSCYTPAHEQLLLGVTCSCLLKKESFPSCYSTAGMAGHWFTVWWDNDPVLGVARSVWRLHQTLRPGSVQRSCFSRALYLFSISPLSFCRVPSQGHSWWILTD